MSSPTVDPELLAYLEQRWDNEAVRVVDTIGAMTVREKKLVREAAVMGFVLGTYDGHAAALAGERRTKIPPDRQILAEVISACLGMAEVYPTVARLEGLAARRRRKNRQTRPTTPEDPDGI